jgi:hypothetical protein
MAIGFKRVKSREGIPISQADYENAQGGFTLETNGLLSGEEVPAGSLFIYDEQTRKARLVRTARVYEAASSSQAVKVEKNHTVKAGTEIEGVEVVSVDNSNEDFDTLNFASAISAELGAVISSESTEGLHTGLLYQSVFAGENETVSISIRCTVYANRIPPVSKDQVPGTILFSKSN